MTENGILKKGDSILIKVPSNETADAIAQALPAQQGRLSPYNSYSTILSNGALKGIECIAEAVPAWFNYLSLTNQKFNNDQLEDFIKNTHNGLLAKVLKYEMPLTDDCSYIPYYSPAQGIILINKENPASSLHKHGGSGNLNRKVLKPVVAQTLINQSPYASAQVVPPPPPQAAQQPRAAPQAAATVAGNADVDAYLRELGLAVDDLPRAITNRMAMGSEEMTDLNAQRGVRDRNAVLGDAGQVTKMYRLPGAASSIYIIRMASGRMVAAITLQPGNYQMLLTSTAAYNMGSATHLFNTLHQIGINEGVSSIMIREFLVQNPSLRHKVKHQLHEFLKQKKSQKQ